MTTKSEPTTSVSDADLVLVSDFVLASGHADNVVKEAAQRLADALPAPK